MTYRPLSRHICRDSQHITEEEIKALAYFYEKHCGLSGDKLILALDHAFRHLAGFSPISLGEKYLPTIEPEPAAPDAYKYTWKVAEKLGLTTDQLYTILLGLGLIEAKPLYHTIPYADGKVDVPNGYHYVPTALGIECGCKLAPWNPSNGAQENRECLWNVDRLLAYIQANYFDKNN